MRLIQGQFTEGANSQGYLAPEWDQILWPQSTVVFGCTYTRHWDLTREFGPGWVNLSQPAAAINFHIRNLELLDQQQSRPRCCVWVMPDPGRITVFDHADRVLRWGVVQADRWHAQGQTPDWDQAIRLQTWRRAAESFGGQHLWLTWSARTHHLVHWDLVPEPDSPDWLARLTRRVRQWAK